MIHSNDLSSGKKPHGDGDDSPEKFAQEAPAVLQKPQVTEHPIPITDEHDNLVVPQIEDSPPSGSYPQPPQPVAGDGAQPGEAGGKLPPKMVTSQKKPAAPSAPLPPLVPQPQVAQPTSQGLPPLPPLPPLPAVSQAQPTPGSDGGGGRSPVPGRPAGAFTPMPQPLPPEQKKVLEQRAKQVIKDLDALRPAGGGSIPPARKGKGAALKYTVAGLLLMIVGAGTFFGIRLLQEQQSAEQRIQAEWTNTCSSPSDVGKYSCYTYTAQAFCAGTNTQGRLIQCPDGWSGPSVSYPHWCTRNCPSNTYCASGTATCDPVPTFVPTATPGGTGDACGDSPADGRTCYYTTSNYSVVAQGTCNNGNDYADSADPFGRGFGCYNGTTPMAHFVCDGIDPGPRPNQGCGYDNGTKIYDGTELNRKFVRDCGMEQIDTVGGFISIRRNNPCDSPPQPTPTPARQNYCVSTTVNGVGLGSINDVYIQPGQQVTFRSVASTSVNNFWWAMYNNQNNYANGTPKPICVNSGGDITNYRGDCPAGTYHLIFQDPSTTLRTVGTRVKEYLQVFLVDRNIGPDGQPINRTVRHFQANGYFSLTGGPTSLPNQDCVVYLHQASAPTPTRTPTPRPSATPTRTPTPSRTPTPRPPTATPTVPAACNSVCTTNAQCPSSLICSGGFCRNSLCTSQTNCVCPAPTATLTPTLVPLACMELNYSPVQPVLGMTIDLTCVGSPLDRVERAEYQYSVNGSAFSAITNVTDLTARLFIGDPGSYTVRCRVCNGQTCTAWDTL